MSDSSLQSYHFFAVGIQIILYKLLLNIKLSIAKHYFLRTPEVTFPNPVVIYIPNGGVFNLCIASFLMTVYQTYFSQIFKLLLITVTE